MKANTKELEKIRKRHNLSLIILHGSRVDGKIHDKSDIDIAVLRQDGQKKFNLLKLISDLSAAFNTDKIDVSDLTHADPLFLNSVVRKSKLLSGRKNDYEELIKLAFHKYSDYLPFLEKEKKFVMDKIKTYVTT